MRSPPDTLMTRAQIFRIARREGNDRGAPGGSADGDDSLRIGVGPLTNDIERGLQIGGVGAEAFGETRARAGHRSCRGAVRLPKTATHDDDGKPSAPRQVTRGTGKVGRLRVKHVAQHGGFAMCDERDREFVGEVGAFDDERLEPNRTIVDIGAKEAALDDKLVSAGNATADECRDENSEKPFGPHARAPDHRAHDSVFTYPRPA